MTVDELTRFAGIKGLNLLGTGDFTHPKWLEELHRNLQFDQVSGFYTSNAKAHSQIYFMPTTEVCTIFEIKNASKKVHHVILAPTLEIAAQLNDRFSKYGNLASDGRPTLSMNSANLVEEVISVSKDNVIFPAHAWTPWFSIFGAFNGFDSMEECYQDMAKHIFALETGLSSDPPMNWRLTKLDQYTLLSNSDCHSSWPWRLGREANVFELEKLSYQSLTEAIRTKDSKRLKFTIETDPGYGKYHYSGHRNCRISLSPSEAIKLGNICPVCRRKLTKGVDQRVEELADRPPRIKPNNAIDFRRLLPLSEIISTVLRVDSPYLQKVWDFYNPLVERFGNEYAVLMETPLESLVAVAGREVGEAIVKVRNGGVKVEPGYDGLYGKLLLSEDDKVKAKLGRVEQRNLSDFAS